jgi:hypothetical protein
VGRPRPALDHTETGNRERPGLCGRLLSLDQCIVALIDHQPQMLFGVENFDRQTIINNAVSRRGAE